jgi:tetratricopeptide (TPR) repeat protein
VLSRDGALELYRAILAEDPDFTHRDAVLFNAGSLLAERGDPEADRCYRDLVTLHPQSVYVQESELRRGDLRFDAKDFGACLPFYERAAQGSDPSLTAIALYKLGWASFNENHFTAAADAFRRVLDLYESGRTVAISTDLRPEAEAYLVHSLARAGGAPVFAAYFDSIGHRPYETRVLMTLGQQFRRFSMVPEAAATDRLVLDRAPLAPEALTSAERLVDTYHRWKDVAKERETQLELAPVFAPGGAWARAQNSDSLQRAGAVFAHDAWLAAARQSHRQARQGGAAADWTAARTLYERVLQAFPSDSEAAPLHLSAGEASEHLGDRRAALSHYREAEGGADSVASQAMWQQVAVFDTWYRTTETAVANGRPGPGSDSLAHAEIAAADRLLDRFPSHPKRADLTWREGNLAFAHGWYERAAADLGRMAERDPGDARTPRAAILRADAFFRLGDYGRSGEAYGAALEIARRAGVDSLAARASAAMPTCDYLAAEASVRADSSAHARHAALFERVAARWPNYEHADQALYRAGLAWAAAGSPREQIRTLEKLGHDYPKSEYARDARLETARAWKALGEKEHAASVYADFADRFPADSSARAAWLEAGDLYADAGSAARAEELRIAYIRRYPDDIPAAMDILVSLARRDLASVGPDRPISSLLPAPTPAPSSKKRSKGAKVAKPATLPATPPSRLAEYMALAAKHPELASPGLMSEVRFRQAEEIAAASNGVALRLPLATSIAKRKDLLDRALAGYRQCIDLGVPRWSHAATYRIGENLVGFGEALETSERPADLQGDDLLAYRKVLAERSQGFYDRGENVWATLLKQQPRDSVADEWVTRAQSTFWKRLSNRFYYQSEVEYPLVAATEPEKTRLEKTRTEKPRSGRKHADGNAGGDGGRATARREGSQP